MSRLDGRPITVETDRDGNPIAFTLPDGSSRQSILSHLTYWREWIGILDGEPERDIWWVETTHGICEIHCLRYLPSGESGTGDTRRQVTLLKEMWLLHAWED